LSFKVLQDVYSDLDCELYVCYKGKPYYNDLDITTALHKDIENRYQKAEEIVDDIKVYTESIQLSVAQKRVRAMFPGTPEIEGFDFHVTFEPMEEIGGDFYDFVPLEDGKWGLRSYSDEPDSTVWGGQDVYDVYSLSAEKALDGTYYRDCHRL